MKKLLFLMMTTVLVSVVAYGRAVSVASVEDDSHGRHVRANLSLSTGENAVLHLAYGTTAGGITLASWEHCRPIARIPGSTTSYTYEFPRDIGDDVAAVRFFLLDDYDMPLVKRYAYVETDGTQFVRTTFVPTGLSAVELGVSLNSVSVSVALFGSRTTNFGDDSFTAFYIEGKSWRFDYFAYGTPGSKTVTSDTDYTLRTDGSGVYVDGEKISQLVAKPTANAMKPLVLFGAPRPNDQIIEYMPSAKFSSIRVWNDYMDDTSLTLDLIPTEKDGETCLYNRVDGTYMKRAAGNALGHGAEVAVVRPAVVAQSDTLTGSFGEERTMHVTAKHRTGSTRRLTSVDLSFTTGLDRKLYVAYGKNDGGDNIANWQNARYVDIISGSTNEYSFAIPESWGTGVNKMRFFLMAKEYIHGCDAVCEGVAVIDKHVDTSFLPCHSTTIDMAISFDTVSESQALFCARIDSAFSMTLFYLGGEGWRYDYRNNQHRTYVEAGIGRKYAINATALGLKVDGLDVVSFQFEGMPRAGSVLTLLSTTTGNSHFKGTLYSFKAMGGANDSIDLDLVPCQKDGQAYLYNRVNGEFLPFSGAGTATPVGATANGASISATDTLSIYSGFVISCR